MLNITVRKENKFVLFCLLILVGFFYRPAHAIDHTKYITLDEVRPGMKAYCLTVYKGTQIEKFDLQVLDIIRNVRPGRDAILVQGTDDRFIHTGPVSGCSGSPVYIDGRLAGALAFGFVFSKDPLYGVTPIENMLSVGTENIKSDVGFKFDFSHPLDFAEIDKQVTDSQFDGYAHQASLANQASRFQPLPCPLITSGLPANVVQQLDAAVSPFGLTAVAGIGTGSSTAAAESRASVSTSNGNSDDIKLEPGACLVVPLVTGDIRMDVLGTVTEAVGGRIYGFGHSFLGYGSVNMPMATGKIYTVVSSVYQSFKFGGAVDIVGAITTDESTAIVGQIGAKAVMIPLTVKIDRYNDIQRRVYNCRIVDNRLYTPVALRYSIMGSALMSGNLPPDHMVEYAVTITPNLGEPISFSNISTSMGLTEIGTETIACVALLMNNPYRKVDIKSIDLNIAIKPKNVVSHIWSANLSDTTVKAGDKINIDVILESFLAGKKKCQVAIKIPKQLAPGKYNLLLCGGYGYLQFLRKAAPYRFMPENFPGLVRAINNILRIKRDKLYCVLILPPGGVTVETAELPDLPATKALILRDSMRTLMSQPYQHWLQKSLKTDTVIVDKKIMHITVEK